ncbi:MAG: YdbL family protein [Gammaproteobacteria bacterium]
MKKFSFLSLLLLTACVTINIYFPAAAAEKAADQIIQDIQKSAPPDTQDDSRADNAAPTAGPHWLSWLNSVVDLVIKPAYAERANLNIDSAEIRQIRAAMKKRFSNLLPFYRQGLIGIRNDGLLAVVNVGAVPLKDRNTVNKLIAAENSDRLNLYRAIANANGHPEWLSEIQSTFAKRWIKNAKASWFYQTANGQWVRK